MTLEELATAALAGDRRAMEELARFLYGKLRRYFTRRQCAPDVVDDLVQRTFVAMLDKKDQFEYRGKNSFMPWVYGFANTESLTNRNELIRMTRAMAKLGEVNKTPARGLSSFIMLMESADMLEDAIKQLSSAQRQAVEKFLDKARGEDRSPNHPAVTLYRARNKLRHGLTERMGKSEPEPEPEPRVDTPSVT